MANSLMTLAPTSRNSPRISTEMLDNRDHYPVMDGKNIFKMAVRLLPEVALESLKMAGLEKEDVTLYIPHQANMRINQFFQQAMKLPEEKVFHNIQRYGNTTAATIPIALDEAMEMDLLGKAGDITMFLGLGSGVTWGSVVYRFPR